MDSSQVAKQIEKLFSRLLFNKKGIKISVESFDENEPRHSEYPSYTKFIINVPVDPYKFNNVTDDFDKSYYEFMSRLEDIVDENVKYLGLYPEHVKVRYSINNKDKFISMMEDIVYEKWPEVEKEFISNINSIALLDEPELTEVSMEQRGSGYPEFIIYIGTKAREQSGNERKQHISNELISNAVHEILPVSEMFVEFV